MTNENADSPAMKQHDGSVILRLVEPIRYGKEEIIEQLHFQKPKSKHVKNLKLQDLQMKDILDLAGKLCAQAPSVMDELSMVDLGAVMDVVTDFLGSMAPSKT